MFGLVDTSQTPALGYMEVVQTRDAATLLPIIQAHVAPGTVVHSDQWRAYSQVASLPSVQNHQTVNHSITFVDLTTGVHTQHVESYWNRVKVKLKHMKGCHSQNIPHEFMYVERETWQNWSTSIYKHFKRYCTTVPILTQASDLPKREYLYLMHTSLNCVYIIDIIDYVYVL